MRIPALVLALALSGSPAVAQEQAGTLDKIRKAGKIVLGARDAAPPFAYGQDGRGLVGYAVDICARLVDAIKAEMKLPDLKVEFVAVNAATRFPLLMGGRIDLECGSTTNTAARQLRVAFTNSHFVTASRFVARKAAGLRRIDDLKGKTVVSVSGSINIAQVNRANEERKLGLKVMGVRDVFDAFRMVEEGKADAFAMDDAQLIPLIAQAGEPSAFGLSEEAFGRPQPYGIMLRRDDAAFKALVDRATAALYAGPGIEAIYRRWFEEPVPPKGLNYHYPMPPAVRRAFARPSDSADPGAYGE